MPYNPNLYRSKNIYLPNELCDKAEQRASDQYMNFSTYVRHLIVRDIESTKKVHII
ncbi:MAG: hypothetical protein UT36_C0003G0010 [Candidatus Peregrinibacteria bacterium GW2011_GWF2_39_17]|nr:MAG: hypothetical protein UT36_C0003G0010 [Candidatus Peregrinibacteria bacterium GW2011_GWF2_39_17]